MVGGVVCGLSQLSAIHPPFGSQRVVAARSVYSAIVLITMARSSGSVESHEDSCRGKVGGGEGTTVGLWSAITDLSKDNP